MTKTQDTTRLSHTFLSPTKLIDNYLISCPGGGLFIHVENPLDLWSRFELTFNLPSSDTSVTCEVEVFWLNAPGSVKPSGMGVRFLDMDPAVRTKLDDYLKKWGRRDDVLDGRLFRIFPSGESNSGR